MFSCNLLSKGCSRLLYETGNNCEFMCSRDLKKAFDKMNHYGLYTKLMDRMIPNCLLSLIEHWFSICATCVRFGGYLSDFFYLKCGVRQGGVLSPHFLPCI